MRRLLVRPWPSVNPDHAKPTSLVPAHMTLVKFIAQRMQARLPPNVEVDDLIQWGTLGLLDAIRKFDPERDNKFKTYAEFRIRGAMLDGLRAIDQTPRTVRALGRKIELTSRELQGELGRAPRPDEISIRLGISVEKFHEAQLDAMPRKEYSIEEKDCFTQADRQALLVSAQNKGIDLPAKIEAMQKLERIVQWAEPTNRACFMLKYLWGLDLNEIGECFGISASRVSQKIKLVHEGRRLKTRDL